MQLEELIATLIASINTNTSSLDENNRLLRAAGASSPPAEPAAPKTRKTKAAAEPEPTPAAPEPEPEPPTLDAPDEMDEPEEDTTDYLELTRQTVRKYRQANPEKAAANKIAYAEVIAKFGVTTLAEVPKEKSKDFYLEVQAIC